MTYRYWVLFSIFFSTLSVASERFKDTDLWLPKIYQKQYSRLLDAAEKAKNDPYCFQLLSGRVLEAQSTLDHLKFNFRCRTEDRKVFSIQVDGNTLVVSNAFAAKQKKLEAERLAKETALEEEEKALQSQILAEKVAEKRREQARYWQICRKAMRKKLKRFEEVTILTDSLPEPMIQADQFTYNVDFDAQNPQRKILHFQIACVISALDNYKITIRARKQEKEDK